MKKFAETIGSDDNLTYNKFNDKYWLVMNVSMSRYFVVRFVAKHIFNFKLSFRTLEDYTNKPIDGNNESQNNGNKDCEEWDILWTDNAIPAERISKMKPYQKTNHFPGMYQLSWKNHLARNLIKMVK